MQIAQSSVSRRFWFNAFKCSCHYFTQRLWWGSAGAAWKRPKDRCCGQEPHVLCQGTPLNRSQKTHPESPDIRTHPRKQKMVYHTSLKKSIHSFFSFLHCSHYPPSIFVTRTCILQGQQPVSSPLLHRHVPLISAGSSSRQKEKRKESSTPS